MSVEVKKATDIKGLKNTVLVYAKPGGGKTTSLGMLPGKTLVLDVDRTTGVLKGNKNIDIIEVDNLQPLESMSEIITEFKKGLINQYDNIALDNLSELERCMLAEYGANGRNDGVPAIGDYQKYQFKVANLIRVLKGFNKNLILTAWEILEPVTSPTGEQYTRFIPKLQSKIVDNICGLCDVVAHLEIDAEGNRGFRLDGTKNVYAKNQRDDRKSCRVNELILGGNK
ncbi:MAG: AAA family ATPase [Coprobacillus sp.]|nr:AAA family ATPase [Coprobacillus sp.]